MDNIKRKKGYIKGMILFILCICFVLSLNHIISFFQLHGVGDGVGKFGYNIWSLLGLIAAWRLVNRMLLREDIT